MKLKVVPRNEDGTFSTPPEREGMWIALQFVDLALTFGLEQLPPSRSKADPVLYNVIKKANELRKAYIDLSRAVVNNDDSLSVLHKNHKTIMKIIKPRAAGGEIPSDWLHQD